MTPIDDKAIAADCRRIHEAAGVALKADGIDPHSVVLTLAGYAVGDQKPRHKHFAVGDHAAMASAAATWTMDGANVYRALVANRKGLKATERGGAEDAVRVFGFGVDLDADKGRLVRLEDLPLPPTLATRTSAEPVENFQGVYLLARAITVEAARPIAWGLAQIAQDTDGGTADPVHVWRVAGTLNYPKPVKIERGRPTEPQGVVFDPERRGTNDAVAPEALIDAIETALGIESLASAYAAATGKAVPAAVALPRVYSANDADRWNGDERELKRVEDALLKVPADDRDVWLKVGMALHDYGRGDDWAYRLWAAWSQGDVQRGFAGSTKFDTALQGQAWAGFGGSGRRVRIGSLFRFAMDHGWDSRRKRFGLGSMREVMGGAVSEGVAGVLAAAAAIPRNATFHEVREVWLDFVIEGTRSVPRIRVAKAVSRFINLKLGYGWAGYRRLAMNTAVDTATTLLDTEDVGEHVRALAESGFLKLSSGRGLNVLGKRGAMYSITPPPNWTWDMTLARRRLLMNHDEDTAWVQYASSQPDPELPAADEATPLNTPRGTPIDAPPQGGIGGNGTPLDHPAQGGIKGSEPHPSITLSTGVSGGVTALNTPRQGGIHYQTVYEEGESWAVSRAVGSQPRTLTVADAEPADRPDLNAKPVVEPLVEPAAEPTVALTPAGQALAVLIAASPAVTAGDVMPWVTGDASSAIPDEVVERIRVAVANRSKAPREVAVQLRNLQVLGLDDGQIRTIVLDAAKFVLKCWSDEKAKKREPVDDPEIHQVPAVRFCRELAGSLAKQAGWTKEKIDSGRLTPGLRVQSGAGSPTDGASGDDRAAFVRKWRNRPDDAYADKPFANSDAADLADEFPNVAIAVLREVISRSCAPVTPSRRLSNDQFPQRPTLDVAKRKARRELVKLSYGPPAAQLNGQPVAVLPAVETLPGGPVDAQWFVPPQRLIDEALAKHPILADASSTKDLVVLVRRFCAAISPDHQYQGNSMFAEDTSLTITEPVDVIATYGRGLQGQVETILRERLAALAASLEKRRAAEAAQAAKQAATSAANGKVSQGPNGYAGGGGFQNRASPWQSPAKAEPEFDPFD
ncbi:MAG: hypothetical protein CTY20_00650 [Hyphomicrobium sp.]|nr:MAG: hypothetical protein CTY20_00650 [Hyphomicrobium sp.]